MASYTEQQILGINSVQDLDTVTIAKADLAQNTGFTASDENDGESLLAGIILQSLALGLDTDHRDGTIDIDANFNQQLAINQPVSTFVTRLDDSGNPVWFKRDSYTIDFDTLVPNVSPNNY